MLSAYQNESSGIYRKSFRHNNEKLVILFEMIMLIFRFSWHYVYSRGNFPEIIPLLNAFMPNCSLCVVTRVKAKHFALLVSTRSLYYLLIGDQISHRNVKEAPLVLCKGGAWKANGRERRTGNWIMKLQTRINLE